jgi:hypothetical protein
MRKSCGGCTLGWRVIPTGCVAGCEGYRKVVSGERLIASVEVLPQLIIWEEIQVNSRIVFFGVSHYGHNTALEECGDEFECGHHLGRIRVVSGGATPLEFLCTCQLDLARVSKFRSIKRFSMLDTIQHG